MPAWNTSAPAASASATPVMADPAVTVFRVSAGREDDGHRRPVRSREVDTGELTGRRGGERLQEVAVDQREHRLRLGVAETTVELQHASAVVGDHQAREQEADERRATRGELREHRLVDRLDQLGRTLGSEPRHRRVGAHAAGVRALVAVVRPLEVLRRNERHRRVAVAEREQRDLRPLEELLHDERIAESRDSPRERRRARPVCGRCSTPLPAARPSALTTHGGRATASAAAVGTPAAAITSFANDFDPSIAAAAELGPKTAIPAGRSTSASPPTSGASGPTTTRSTPSACERREQPLGVLGANRMAFAEPRDPGTARARRAGP